MIRNKSVADHRKILLMRMCGYSIPKVSEETQVTVETLRNYEKSEHCQEMRREMALAICEKFYMSPEGVQHYFS